MKTKTRQSGMSLIEQTLIVATVALLIFFGIPAVRTLFDQMHTTAGVKATISAALTSARAMAAQQQRYVGIRFQHSYDKGEPSKSPLRQPQYIIFIVHDPEKTNLANGFRAIEGIEPIKLPQHIGVMDLLTNDDEPITNDSYLDEDEELIDATTFSIVFSPTGKLAVKDVRIRNRDGYDRNNPYSEDDIFNIEENVRDGIALFLQDDYKNEYNLGEEKSRRSFIIYDRSEFKNIDENDRYSDYIERIINTQTIYLNPYTGMIIKK